MILPVPGVKITRALEVLRRPVAEIGSLMMKLKGFEKTGVIGIKKKNDEERPLSNQVILPP